MHLAYDIDMKDIHPELHKIYYIPGDVLGEIHNFVCQHM